MNRLATEFIGTFFLVFTILVAAIFGIAGDFAPLAIGLVLTALVYAGGHISKAHYNPAVSLAFLIRGGYYSAREMAGYLAAQFLGAAAAAGIAAGVFSPGKDVAPVALDPTPALVAELLFSFLLVWVILNVATARGTAGNPFYGIAIGATVAGAIYTVGLYSLAVLNPAVALSLVLVGKLDWTQAWIPVGGSAAAAVIAAVFFKLGEKDEEAKK